MKLFQNFLNLINKDVDNENETKTVPVMLRIISVSMILYFLLMLAYLMNIGLMVPVIFNMICIILLCASFLLTYKEKYSLAVLLSHIGIIIWIFLAILYLGWECGAQQFVTLLLVSIFMTSYVERRIKVEYSILLILIHVGLHLFMTTNVAFYAQSFWEMLYTHIISIVFCFGTIIAVVVTFSHNSISMEAKLKGYNANLKRLANVDPLTGLKNRRCMMNYLKENVESTNGKEVGNAVIAIGDIDFFKRFNDRYGHACGDEVLVELAALFMDFMEDKGEVARWGGEEFLLVFNDCDMNRGIEYMDKLLHRIRLMNIRYGGEELRVTMTFGISEYDNDKTIDAIINQADKKLYYGKQNGRNRLVHTIPTDFVIDKK